MTIPEKIKQLRKEKGLTQTAFGLLFTPPVKKQYICDIEAGKANLSIESIEKIANVLGVKNYFLIDEK